MWNERTCLHICCHFLKRCVAHTRMCADTVTERHADTGKRNPRDGAPVEIRSATVKHTKTDLEPVKCKQTDDKTTTDGSTEERRATHSTQLATCCCMTPMGYGILP